GLKEHRFSSAGRRDDQATLALANRDHQVHHPGGKVVGGGLQLNPLVGIERCEVVEKDLVASNVWVLEINGFYRDQGKIPLSVLGRTNLPGDRIASVQIELTNLGRRDVNVVWPGKIIVVWGSQKAESVGKSF